jgi:uncharacterized protein (TIGR03435 family)
MSLLRLFATPRETLCLLAVLGVTLAGQAPLEFEVASIKQNTTNTFATAPPPAPASGDVVLINASVEAMVLRAYPLATTPVTVIGLPDWGRSNRYDVVAKGKPGATTEERQQMWRALLADRMKLQAHYDTRPRSAYKLVVARADGRLGPQLKRSTLSCPPPDPAVRLEVSLEARNAMLATLRDRRRATPEEETVLLSQCRGTFNAWNTIYGGAITISTLIQSLRFLGLDRPVVDETALEGLYSVKLWAGRAAPPPGPIGAAGDAAAALDEPPSLFSALQDQLGLKLEPTTIEGEVLVVDHIERPTEN